MSDEKLIEKTNETISELVKPHTELLKAYNYYNGIRDAELYRYLEENFGIGNPTQVEFTPLIKKHIDALIGEFLGTPIIPKVTCKDSETISNINRDKQLYINLEVYKFLQSKVKNSILQFIEQGQMTDTSIKQQLDKLVEQLEGDFVSEYEKSALWVIEYIMQSRETDMETNLRHLLLDLLVAGYCIFRCKPSFNRNNVKIEVLDPRNTFIDRNIESIYLKDSYRVVIRKWLSKELIISLYGKDLKKEDLKSIKEQWKEHFKDANSQFLVAHPGEIFPAETEGLDYGCNIAFGEPYDNHAYWMNVNVIPVYEVEWIEVDKDYVMQRYETVRIGEDIFILKGKNDNVVRTKDNPNYCGLSINGIYFTNRSYKPYSLMLSCASLLDRYDLLNFIRDTVIANSGSVGDYIDMSMLPTWLGTGPAERLLKYIAYKKIGIAPIDTALEGRLATGQAPINTIFNGYDDTVKTQAIQAILLAIQSIEETVSSITGVFRERLQGIEQHDAVTNIKQGVQNSYIVTKQYYQLMNLVTCEMLVDALNVAKVVYKNGLTGQLILGDKYQKIFTALPEHFTFTDYDIHVSTSTDITKDLETIKQLVPEFLKSNLVEPEIVFEALTCKSLTELRSKALISMRKKKLENDQIQQLQQQGEQLQQQLQQAQQELQKAQQQVQKLNEQKLLIEQQKVNMEGKLGWFEALTDRMFKNKLNEINEKKVNIELAQLTDGNPYNDEVKY